MRTTLTAALRGALALTVLVTLAGAPARAAGPASTSPPVVAGTPEVGRTLTVSAGGWTASGGLVLAYRWQRCLDASYAAEVLADAPVAYYRLGDAAGSADLTDATGNESTGVFRNGVALELDGGPFPDTDGAAGFDGLDDYAEVPDRPALDLGDAFTLEAWIRPAGLEPGHLLDKGEGAFSLAYAADGRVRLLAAGAGTVVSATEPVPADGAFHHVVATKDGPAAALYLDGAEVGGAVTVRELRDTANALRLGRAHGYLAFPRADFFAGELDEVALYRRALTAARVRAHYDVGSAGCATVAGAQGNAYTLTAADHGATVRALVTASDGSGSTTVPTAGTAAVTTSVPVGLEAPVVWGEPAVGSELVAGVGEWAGAEPIDYAVRWQSCLDRRYRATVLADSPSAYWRLGELAGTAAADESGRGNAGAYANGVALRAAGALRATGDGNRAARFDGVDDAVAVPDRASLDLGDRLTLEAWVRRDAAGTNGYLVHKGHGAYALRIGADDRVHLARAGSGDVAVSTVAVPADGGFHHVVATKDGRTARIFVDGEEATEPVAERTLADTGRALQLGRVVSGSGAASVHFGGELDEVAVYGRALAAERVRAHHDMGRHGCTSLAGATGTAYGPGPEDSGRRLRVLVTASNGFGSAVAASAPTQAPVGAAGAPVVAAGTLTDAAGAPLAGAQVSLHLWPAADAVPVGAAAATSVVATTTTDAAGSYVLRAEPTPAIRAEADANGGVVNFEVRAEANGLVYQTFLERDFGQPAAGASGVADTLVGTAAAAWQEGAARAPAAPLRLSLAEGDAGVASLQADPPFGGVECSNWDKTFKIWKRTGQGEAYTRVGELHTWSSMTNRFSYGTRADSDVDVAFKTPGSPWRVNGSVHVGNSSGQSTAAAQSATTGPGEYTSRAVKARFVYTYWHQCGTGAKKARAARWNGYNLGKGVRVSTRDGECSDLANHVFDPGQEWTRDRNRAVHWGGAADLGFFVVGAESGYSTFVRSEWDFGTNLASRTLCGVSKPPATAKRVFAGW
ncbi:MAG TPA: LamG domain-containing protein [Gaiellaceae bacterium]|nr:LamG domain-containing protein [Gaiellaceae bacterium]